MASAISFGWFADRGKIFTIISTVISTGLFWLLKVII